MRNRDVESNLLKIFSICNKIDLRRSISYAINNVEDDSNRFQEFKLKIQKNLSRILPQENQRHYQFLF